MALLSSLCHELSNPLSNLTSIENPHSRCYHSLVPTYRHRCETSISFKLLQQQCFVGFNCQQERIPSSPILQIFVPTKMLLSPTSISGAWWLNLRGEFPHVLIWVTGFRGRYDPRFSNLGALSWTPRRIKHLRLFLRECRIQCDHLAHIVRKNTCTVVTSGSRAILFSSLLSFAA